MIEVLTAECQPANGTIAPENVTTAHGWKNTTWTKVVEALKGSEEKINQLTGLVQVSVVKPVKVCKNHWYIVSFFFPHL